MPHAFRDIETKAVHAGEPAPRIEGAVSMPIFQTAMFEYDGEETGYHDLRYIRLNNTPNHHAVQQKLAALENAEAALVAASGMAAISTTLLTLLASGDHLLAQSNLYGGTHDFITKDLPALGIAYDFINGNAPESWAQKLRPTTRVLYVEAMSNPMLQVADLRAAVTFANAHGLVAIIDNTFASPYNFRPAEWGFDLSLHSGTKYLNGHSDIVAGAVIGRAGLVENIRHKLNHLGGALDPHACFLLQRGIATLAVRMKQHNESALQLARFLSQHREVARVNYPGLESHPQQHLAREFFNGYSGMLSFELHEGLTAAKRFIARTQIPIKAPSLGSIHTLITRPATTSHAGLAAEERLKLGITDSLIRVSVGIESTEELLADFDQALRP